LIKGVVLDKEVVHGGMPKRVENAKAALITVRIYAASPVLETSVGLT
jgi:hypothetical protein